MPKSMTKTSQKARLIGNGKNGDSAIGVANGYLKAGFRCARNAAQNGTNGVPCKRLPITRFIAQLDAGSSLKSFKPMVVNAALVAGSPMKNF